MGDLIEYRGYKWHNNGYKYILLLIDCFSKMIYVAPMKKKSSDDSILAFESIFSKLERFPQSLATDSGKEFVNAGAQNIFETYGINHYTLKSKMKAMIAERAIRTIKERLEKYFSKSGETKWIDVIDQFVENYNKQPHSTTGYAPLDVNEENQAEIYKKMYPNKKLKVACRLKIGDKVRKLVEKDLFDKGYKQRWSEEIYEIVSVRQSNIVCWYKIKEVNGETLAKSFYYYQLNLVVKNDD